jgi:hypothetical protein
MNKDELVYVKDDEGYAMRKEAGKIAKNETIITEVEYKKIVGHDIMIKLTARGGKREGAGRKKIYTDREKTTFELEQNDIINLRDYAKKHKISQNRAIHEAISLLSRKEA